MPIKSFTFAFKLDAKELLNYVVERNIAVDIHATGQRRQEMEQLPAPEQPLALPPPRSLNSRNLDPLTNSRGVVLTFLAKHDKVSAAGLRALLVQSGFAASTFHGMIWSMHKAGLVRKAGKGHYRIAAKGRQMVEDLS
jgi:hypothetical protein